MKKRSTRQRISWSMALLTWSLIFVVTMILNGFVFINWYHSEVRALQRAWARDVLWQRMQRNIRITSSDQVELLEEWTVWNRLSNVWDDWFIISMVNGDVVVRQVTWFIHRQENLLIGSWLLICIAAVIAYILANSITRKLLTNIENLTQFVESRTMDTLNEEISFPSLPWTDPLARLTRSIIQTNSTLSEKINTIQQFALYAAHELKSPLMSMRWSLDLALKTTNYHKYFTRLEKTVSGMEYMIQSLLSMVDPHRWNEQPQLIVLQYLLTEVCQSMNNEYDIKKYHIEWNQWIVINQPQWVLTTVLNNILSNTWKYHIWNTPIKISYKKNAIMVTNTTSWISKSDLEFFCIPFWQWNTGSQIGHGLWLWVVQSLCTTYDRELSFKLENHDTLTTILRFS